MKLTKRLTAMFLTILMVISMVPSSFAVGTQNDDWIYIHIEDDQDLVERNIDDLSKFFQGDDAYHIFNCDGTDISEEFYQDNLSLYINGNFSALLDILTNDNLMLFVETPSYSITRASTQTLSGTASRYISYRFADNEEGSRFQVSYTLSVTIQYDASSQTITSISNPTINNRYIYIPAQHQINAYDETPYSRINLGGGSATFGYEVGGFHIIAWLVTGIAYRETYAEGPYNFSVDGYPQK